MKITPSDRTNFDANQGKFIRITFLMNRKNPNQKNVSENIVVFFLFLQAEKKTFCVFFLHIITMLILQI